jgi:hypothetical protein
MIAAISARTLLAVLGLLACATAASAGCAWVLWYAPQTQGANIPPSHGALSKRTTRRRRVRPAWAAPAGRCPTGLS